VELEVRVTVPPLPRGDTRRPSRSIRMGPIELGKQGGVGQGGRRDPTPILWTIALPVHQVLETPALSADRQELFDSPDRVIIWERWKGWDGGRQGADGNGF